MSRLVEMIETEKEEKEALNQKVFKLEKHLESMGGYYNCLLKTNLAEVRNTSEKLITEKLVEVENRMESSIYVSTERIGKLEKALTENDASDLGNGRSVISSTQITRKAPKLLKFNGKNCNLRAVKRWLCKADECLSQLGLKGLNAIQYVKDSLEEPALTRVRLARPSNLEMLSEVLMEAYGENISVTEVKHELWSRKQG